MDHETGDISPNTPDGPVPPTLGKNISPSKAQIMMEVSDIGTPNTSLFEKDKIRTIGEETNDSDDEDEPGFLSGRGLNY